MDAIKLLTWIFVLGTGSVLSQNTAFKTLVDDFWAWRLRNNPEFASNVGNHQYDSQLEDYSLGAFETRRTDMEAFQSRLIAISRLDLSASDKITYDVLKDILELWIGAYKWRYYGPMNGISFLEGIQTNHGSRAGQLKFEAEKDFWNFAERIYNYGHQVNQTIARMNKAIEMGTTYNTVSMTKVPGQLDLLLAYKNNESYFSFYAPFKDGGKMDELVTNNQISAVNRTAIRTKALAGIRYFLNQVETLKDYLVNTYMSNTRADLGVLNLPEGDQYYRACLKWHLSVDLTPDEIHQKGLTQVAKLRGKIEKIMQKANYQGGFKDYLEYLRNDEQFYLSSKDEVLQRLNDTLYTRIIPKLGSYFKEFPSFPLECNVRPVIVYPGRRFIWIREMPYDGPPGIYKNGAIDGSRPGIYYANVMDVRNSPTYGMPALLMHESDPGHHLQDAYSLTSSSIPDFRKATDFSKYFAAPLHFPFFTAYSEGWAMYSEDLGEELGIYENDYERIGKYTSEIFRAARLVVDTGIHAKGWDKTTAVQYFLNNTASSQASLEKEVDRYSTWPGQATSYMIGKLKFNEIRENAMRELCSAFDMKEFHAIVLENGAMPLSVMETLVKNWVSEVKATSDQADLCQTAGAQGLVRTLNRLALYMVAVSLSVLTVVKLY